MIQEQYRVALWADENGIDEARSEKKGISGGTIAPGELSGLTITSQEPCYGGIRLTGGEYHISDLTVRLDGSGGDDFGGKGTGLVCAGNSKVTVDNYVADNRGVIRNAVVDAGLQGCVFLWRCHTHGEGRCHWL